LIENWRRFYRVTQKITSVPYYTPPEAGEVMQDDRKVNMPVSMQDAIRCEFAWRNLASRPKKLFIKYEYISRMPKQVIWRKLKKEGVIIRNHNEHLLFTRSALDHFIKALNDN
jgi:hypothetical protein